MMEKPKVFEEKQLKWESENNRRLDYQRNFEKPDNLDTDDVVQKEDSEGGNNIDIRETLRKRDRKWKLRLRNAREVAFEEGFTEGKQAGMDEARTEIEVRLKSLEHILEKAQQQWDQRQELLLPGLLDLVFDLTQAVVEKAVENEEIRKYLNQELLMLLQQLDETASVEVNVSDSDYEYVEKLIDQSPVPPSVTLKEDESMGPAEFRFETEEEVVVRKFEQLIEEFKQNLSIPSWK
jgi:flagellar biosynthesis/type III secretory pathway protein FliH